MLLVLCVDLDDDLGRKTGMRTPVLGRDDVEEAAVALATADPEDSDVNVLFQGIHVYEEVAAEGGEEVEVAAVTGVNGSDVKANRVVGEEVDTVLASLQTGENVRAIVITDGAQDESVLPVIRSRVPIDGVRRVVVRQAQDLESMYYTMKQVLADPETRGTILVPLGILLLIYPFVVVASLFQVPGTTVLGLISALLGLYTLFRGLGLESVVDDTAEHLRNVLYAGRVTLITYIVAAALLAVGSLQGLETLRAVQDAVGGELPPSVVLAALVHGAVQWFAVAGITSSLGQVTDEYLANRFKWRYLNAPFYVVAIALVLYAVSGFFLSDVVGLGPMQVGEVTIRAIGLTDLAVALTVGTLLGVFSTVAFAIAESRFPTGIEADAA
jgi:putative membrane protein